MEIFDGNFLSEMLKQVQHDKKYKALRSFVKIFTTEGSEDTELDGNFAGKMLKQVQHDKKLILKLDDFIFNKQYKPLQILGENIHRGGLENHGAGWQLCL